METEYIRIKFILILEQVSRVLIYEPFHDNDVGFSIGVSYWYFSISLDFYIVTDQTVLLILM